MKQAFRQVHLDFHTSPFIGNVGNDFHPAEFAANFKKAHVNSVTLFAKCHHGMFYYPSKMGCMHPGLKHNDLLGEMIDALHSQDIRTPIYTTVGWEEKLAHDFPEWRQMKKDGTFANLDNSADGVTIQPAPWKFLNWLHPQYQDYILEHVTEILQNYAADGIFLDIVFFHPQGGWSETAFDFRKNIGFLDDSPKSHLLFETAALRQFCQKVSKHIWQLRPGMPIFYNTPNFLYIDPSVGTDVKNEFQTHFEIESLPSGFWGYHHFPRLARRIGMESKIWFGMTGKFQKMWGDFGGLKRQTALEYECFRSQAFGGGNIVGDQLHPSGKPDLETYELIGAVYEQVKQAEPFYQDSVAMPQVGIVSPNHPDNDFEKTTQSEEGIVQLLEELHYDAAIIHSDSDFNRYSLLVFPDYVVMDEKLKEKTESYLKNGGKCIFSFQSGFSDDIFSVGDIQLSANGCNELFPSFWRNAADYAFLKVNDRVIYQQGINIRKHPGATTIMERVLPYFRRTDLKYCSHFHAPANEPDQSHDAVFSTGDCVFFAEPVFNEYRTTGNEAVRIVLKQVLADLIGAPECGRELSPSILCVPRKKNGITILTLLKYIPSRRSLQADTVDEGLSFGGDILHTPIHVKEVKCFLSGKPLIKKENGQFILPNQKGRLLLEIH